MTECSQSQFEFEAHFSRRVVAKAEQIEGKENPRYVVTSLAKEDWPAPALDERLYYARGEMENRRNPTSPPPSHPGNSVSNRRRKSASPYPTASRHRHPRRIVAHEPTPADFSLPASLNAPLVRNSG